MALRRGALGELRMGAALLAIVLALLLLLTPALASERPILGALAALVCGAVVIALWVIVWAPVDRLFVQPVPFVWQRRSISVCRTCIWSCGPRQMGSA